MLLNGHVLWFTKNHENVTNTSLYKLDLRKDELPAEEVSEDTDVAKPEEVAKGEGDQEAPEPDQQDVIPPEQPLPPSSEQEATPDGAQVPDQEKEETAASKPVTLSELAPPPSEKDLFGDIDQLKKQHEEELAEFEKAQELNKARVEQGLHEKLRARRSRRRKIQEDKQAEAAMHVTLPPPESNLQQN